MQPRAVNNIKSCLLLDGLLLRVVGATAGASVKLECSGLVAVGAEVGLARRAFCAETVVAEVAAAFLNAAVAPAALAAAREVATALMARR